MTKTSYFCFGEMMIMSVVTDTIIIYRLAEGQLFSQGPPVSPTNKTDRHNITEILLTMALNTIKLNQILENLLINNYIDLY
jgi:hypothetical protein